MRTLLAVDQYISSRLSVLAKSRPVRWMAILLAHTGDSPLWIGIGLTALARGTPRQKGIGRRILAGTLLTGLTIGIMKSIIRRQRPTNRPAGLYTQFDPHAFPSGHAGRTACVAALLASTASDPLTRTLLTAWVIAVGISRITLRAHFVSDVLGGWGIGLVAAQALTRLPL